MGNSPDLVTIIFAVMHAGVSAFAGGTLFPTPGVGASLRGAGSVIPTPGLGSSLGNWDSIFTCPVPFIVVFDGLLIGSFVGLVFILFRFEYQPPIGLLVSMALACWLFHILFNLAVVAFNVVVNIVFGRSWLLHVGLRLTFFLFAVIILWQVYAHGAIPVVRAIWR